MDFLPIFVNIKQQPCLVVGGGAVAARKVSLVLKAGAKVTVVSPELARELSEMAEKGEVNLDDPVENFVPSDQVSIPSFNGKKVTLEHLSTHTGGFPLVPANFLMSDMYNPFSEYSVGYLYDFLSNFELR